MADITTAAARAWPAGRGRQTALERIRRQRLYLCVGLPDDVRRAGARIDRHVALAAPKIRPEDAKVLDTSVHRTRNTAETLLRLDGLITPQRQGSAALPFLVRPSR